MGVLELRRGRKKKLGDVREPNGRRSRAMSAQSDNAEPIAVRMRLFGLSEADARDQKAETVVGRLRLTGRISEGQCDAADEYRKQAEAYRRALSAPDSLRNATQSGGEREEDSHTRWCKAVIAKYEASQKAVMTEQCILDNRGRTLIAALDYLVLRNEFHKHLIGDLRVALNALGHHYGCS